MNGKIDQKIKGTLSPCGSMCTKCWEIKVLLTNQYIRFVEVASGIIRNSRIPLYSSKFLIKTYSQHQLLILILLKEYLSEAYRDIVNLSGSHGRDHTENQSRFDSSFYDTPQIFSKNRLFYIYPIVEPAH